jgi:Leucine Rich Repeat (LRR) protein
MSLPPVDAFALGFQPSYLGTLLATQEVTMAAGQDTANKELQQAVAFALKALRITAEGDARRGTDIIAKLAAKHGLQIPAPPKMVAEHGRWYDAVVAAARQRAGDDAIANVAIDTGRAAGQVSTAMWVARNTIYLRASAPQHALLVADAEKRAQDLAAGLEALRAALARRPLPQYVIAVAGKIEVRVANIPDIASGASAEAMKTLFEWAHKLSLLFLELGAAVGGPIEAEGGPPSDEERYLMRQILANPEDDMARLRYGELAAKRNDPRADLIQAQMILASLRARGPIDMQQVGHMKNAAQLIAAHPEWTQDVLALGPEAATLRRGFVDEITIKADLFLQKAGEIYRVAPVLHVRFREAAGRGAALAASPHLARLRSLSFDANGISDDDVVALAAAESVERLRYLDLTRNNLTSRGLEAICASPHLKGLIFCSVAFNDCPDPVDRREYYNESQFEWVPTPIGKELEAKHGPLPWLHPHGASQWPPNFDQI